MFNNQPIIIPDMAKPNRGLRRLFMAAHYSWSGLRDAYRREESFRQEVALALVLIPLGLWLGGNALERGLLVCSVLLMLIVELLNTAIETVVDKFGSEHNELSGQAKDLGSAAVSLSLLIVAITWGSVLLP